MKNTQDIIDKIVEFYADYDYPAELVDKVQAWLGDDRYRDQKDRALESALDKTVEMYDRQQLYTRKEIDAALKNVRRKIGAEQSGKVNMFSRRLRRVAAILVPIFLLAGIGLLLIDGADDTTKISSIISVSVHGGEEKLVTLPDGSKVRLNANSCIAYDGEGFAESRKVELEGEAFFEVERDERHPFSVVTDHLDVKVLGTKFNVSSFKDAAQTKVALAEGSVEVAFAGDTKESVQMEYGTELTYDKVSGETSLGQIGNCWWEVPLVFDRMGLDEIFDRLEMCYEIEINRTAFAGATDTFSFEFERSATIEEVMRVISMLSGTFTYDIRGGTITIRPVLAP